MLINTDIIQKLIGSDEVSAYEIEQATGISRMTIGNYRNGKARLEKMHLGSAEKLYKFALEKEMDKMDFVIDYNTGVKHTIKAYDLDEAKEQAQEQLSYTQESVNIYQNGELVATLPWYGVTPEEDAVVTEQFGDYGFYGEWYYA